MARVVVMGSAGTATTLVGAAVAARLRASFADGGDLWPRTRRRARRRTEQASRPDHEVWFGALCATLSSGRAAVVTTAPLTRGGRDLVRQAVPGVFFVEIVPETGAVADDTPRDPLTQDEHGVRVADDADLTSLVSRIVELAGAG